MYRTWKRPQGSSDDSADPREATASSRGDMDMSRMLPSLYLDRRESTAISQVLGGLKLSLP